MQDIFAELAKGNGKPLVDSMTEDFCWIIPGNSTWSRTWRGKRAVMGDLMRPLFARFATTYTNEALRFIAEDDYVVVECRGKVMTKSGKPYNNRYCYVCRLANGRLSELTEYMDTELAASTLGAP
jgi:ketosteroid isomerase-like protein